MSNPGGEGLKGDKLEISFISLFVIVIIRSLVLFAVIIENSNFYFLAFANFAYK